MQACAFPKIEWAWLAWLAPGLLLLISFGQPARRILRIGYLAGLGHYLSSLYWLLLIPLPIRAVAAWLAVSGFLALYTAFWLWLCWKLFPSDSGNQKTSGKRESAVDRFRTTKVGRRVFWALLCACAWVTMEMAAARILTGFPWNLLGASQYKLLPLIQIASLTGIYGVSFLMAWVSVSLACVALVAWRQRAALLRAGVTELIVPLAVLFAVIAFGFRQLSQPLPNGRELRIALVQPGIPQLAIWEPNERTNRFKKLVALSGEALAKQPDLLVWPEAALPNMLTRFNQTTHDAITNLVQGHGVWMILGADDAEPKRNSSNPDEVEFFNSSFLVNPRGELIARYHKRKLVMFGEYMPLARWLSFLNRLRSANSGFSSGPGPVPFELRDLGVKISVLICFEDVFPHLVRKSIETDTDFLLNLTNNGWFGESAAQWQHAVSAAFRAVENGLPLVRCTNNGLTCWIDSRGRMHDVYFANSKDIYGAGFKIARIPLRPRGEKRSPTWYARHGDWFGWSCVGLMAAMLITRAKRKS